MDISSFIVCPQCQNELKVFKDHWDCISCKRSYPVIHDIVDLRTPPIHTEPNIDEAIERFEELSFQELTEILLSDYRLPERIKGKVWDYYNQQNDRTSRMTKMFIDHAEIKNYEFALDLGCGSGASINTLIHHFKFVFGVDASMGQLLLAKKSLPQNEGNFLICAYGEKLPFREKTFNYIQALNVIEHLSDVPRVFQEIKRCLFENGTFIGDSRNRFDIFAPEPHTGIRLLGFLPRQLIPKYVNWRCNADYEQTYLLSFWELRQNLLKVFQPAEIKIQVPDITAYGYHGNLLDVFNKIKNWIIIKQFLLLFFFSHQITISKLKSFPDTHK